MASRSNRFRVLSGSIVVAFASILPQVSSLVIMEAYEFGIFSVSYLLYALGVSISLSLVSEPWSRSKGEGVLGADGYASISILIGSIVGVGAIVTSSVMGASGLGSLMMGIASASATVRSSLRYVSVYQSRWGSIARAELTGIAVFALIISTLLWGGWSLSPLEIIATAWALEVLLPTLLDWPLGRKAFGSPISWLKLHWPHAKHLLRDSILMDLGAVGAPLVLVAPLGAAGFGVYRAVSNVAAPVRMLLNPVRAAIGSRGASLTAIRNRSSLAIYAVGVSAGLATWLALIAVREFPLELGVLTGLSAYALPTALFVTSNFLGHYAYIRCRHVASGATLLRYRLVQTFLMFALPLVGLLVGRLEGAVWGLALAALVSGVGWITAESK